MKVLSKFQMLLIIFMTILLFTGVIITIYLGNNVSEKYYIASVVLLVFDIALYALNSKKIIIYAKQRRCLKVEKRIIPYESPFDLELFKTNISLQFIYTEKDGIDIYRCNEKIIILISNIELVDKHLEIVDELFHLYEMLYKRGEQVYSIFTTDDIEMIDMNMIKNITSDYAKKSIIYQKVDMNLLNRNRAQPIALKYYPLFYSQKKLKEFYVKWILPQRLLNRLLKYQNSQAN